MRTRHAFDHSCDPDVCSPAEVCPVWTVNARDFPARGAKLVGAGTISVIRDGDHLWLEYDLSIEGVPRASLPGPLPPQCLGEDGRLDRSRDYQRGLHQAGVLRLDLLVGW